MKVVDANLSVTFSRYPVTGKNVPEGTLNEQHRDRESVMTARIGITLGDPAGIGPEVVAKALAAHEYGDTQFHLIGCMDNFRFAASSIGVSPDVYRKHSFTDIRSGRIDMGRVSGEAGSVAVRSIETASRMAMDGELDGICTAPISKEAIRLAGSPYMDHTEMLGALTGTERVSTVFETGSLRIIFLNKHISLRDAISSISVESVNDHILLADSSLRALGINNGKIAVAALNPHGGENGMLGREELDIIAPAVKRASATVRVSGPYPADSVFYRASRGEFDIVLSLFHDQGHIAAKMYDFERTVSMNIGLPFLRTSVDHGTAFDIAGKWIAGETSMIEAIGKAARYSRPYRQFRDSEASNPGNKKL